MRIAFIGQKGIPTKSGGVERHVEELAVRLASEGHEVTVYGRKSYGISKEGFFRGVRVLGMPSIATKNLDAITATFLATLHALTQPYDIVHYHSIGPASLSWMIRLFKRSAVLIGTFHSPDYEHEKWGWFARRYFHFGEWVICLAPHRTITISKSLKRYAKKAHNRETTYIPNGSSVKPVSSTRTFSKWGLKPDRYILSVSRLVKHKGIHFLIEAFKRLEDTNKLPNNFKLVIVGASSKTDEYVRYLKFLARGRKNIIFTGEQSGIALKELFSHAYLFAQPSLSEGLSIALLEAMGYGLAPLVSDIPENREAIGQALRRIRHGSPQASSGQAGFTFLSGNTRDLEKKLAYLLNTPDEVARAARNAQERARKEYHWDSIAQKTRAVYQEELLRREAKTSVAYPRKV